MDYETILRTANETEGLRVRDLVAMGLVNDPFYAGRPNRKEAAEWFEKLFDKYGGFGYHLRRLHYKILGQVEKPDGSPYENTKKDWQYLLFSSANARFLGLVSYADFVDRRNPPPKVISEHSSDPLYSWYMQNVEIPNTEELYPDIGYNFNPSQFHSHQIEIWAEKSTMDDVLIPLCEKYGAGFVSGAGYESLTHINSLLARIIRNEKPCRIFYISDYDIAGQCMPRQVSRHIEFRIQEERLGIDVRLKPIILLKEDVKKYALPGAPDKKQTELDALEALHPGEFKKIVTSYLEKYIDLDDSAQLVEQLDSIEESLNDSIKEEIEDEFGKELEELDKKITDLSEKVNNFIEQRQFCQPNTDEIVKPIPKEIIEDDDWLFATGRSYSNQLNKYKEFEFKQQPDQK